MVRDVNTVRVNEEECTSDLNLEFSRCARLKFVSFFLPLKFSRRQILSVVAFFLSFSPSVVISG